MPAVEAEVRPAEEVAAEDKVAELKAQAAANGGDNGVANGDSADEVKRLREENEKLTAKVAEQEKEIEGLKADVQKYKEEAEGKRKRSSSTSKGKTGRFGRKKKNAEDQAPAAETSPEAETAPEEVGASGEEAQAAAGEEAATNETDTAAAAAPESDTNDQNTPKKKGGIKNRLGRAFGRFRHPKGYEETPKDEPETTEGAAKPEEFQVADRKEVTWTVAKSFERPAEPVEGAQAEGAAAQPEGESCVAFKDWTVEAVREWLTDLQLERYAEHWQLNGEQMLKTSDAQFDKELGVHNHFHRKKLRLTLNAIASGADLPKELLQWDLKAVAGLLQYHGIPQHIVELFVENSIDGRVLTFLTMDDMNAMKISSAHLQACIKRAIQLLRKHNYNGDYMKKFEAPPMPEEEEEEPQAQAAEEPKPEEAAAEKPAEGEEKKEEEKPAEGEQKEEVIAEKTEEEKKAEEEKAAAEEAKKKEEAEKRKAEAAKRRELRFFELCLTSLKEQKEIVTWSNSDVIVWAKAAGVPDQADHLAHSGVSGALMVLDPCCTAETLSAALGFSPKDTTHRELVATKFAELLGEEVMGQKSEASKMEHYAALIPGAKAKRKRSLSFSGALRRKQRGEKPAPPSIFLCSMDEVPTEFVEAHTKDCSVPPPEEAPAAAEGGKEGDKEAEKTGEEKAEESKPAEDASPKGDEETAPLVQKEPEGKEEKAAAAEPAPAEPAPAEPAPAEAAPEPQPEEEKKDEAASPPAEEEPSTEKSKLLEDEPQAES